MRIRHLVTLVASSAIAACSWPAHVTLNQTIPSAPASLDAAGSFVAKVP